MRSPSHTLSSEVLSAWRGVSMSLPAKPSSGPYHIRNTIKTRRVSTFQLLLRLLSPVPTGLPRQVSSYSSCKILSSCPPSYLSPCVSLCLECSFPSSCHNWPILSSSIHLPINHQLTGFSVSLPTHYYSNCLVHTSAYLFNICLPLTKMETL